MDTLRTWALLPKYRNPLTDEELYELTVVNNLYERLGVWPDDGTEFEFVGSGRVVRMKQHTLDTSN